MLAAVEDVQHRHGQRLGRHSAEIAIERLTGRRRRRVSNRHRHRQCRVGTEARFVFGGVEGEENRIDPLLISRIKTEDRFGDLAVHILNRLRHALAKPTALVAIAQLDRLVLASRRARRNRRASGRPVLENDLGFECRIAA